MLLLMQRAGVLPPPPASSARKNRLHLLMQPSTRPLSLPQRHGQNRAPLATRGSRPRECRQGTHSFCAHRDSLVFLGERHRPCLSVNSESMSSCIYLSDASLSPLGVNVSQAEAGTGTRQPQGWCYYWSEEDRDRTESLCSMACIFPEATQGLGMQPPSACLGPRLMSLPKSHKLTASHWGVLIEKHLGVNPQGSSVAGAATVPL